MGEKLVVVEGPTRSGKSALLTRLRADGFIGLRGIPSQHQRENRFLAGTAQKLLEGVTLNFRGAMDGSEDERNFVIDCFTQVTTIQQKRALEYLEQGKTVFLNRSAISLAAFMDLEYSIALGMENPQLAEWASTAGSRVREATLNTPLYEGKTFLGVMDGLILLRKPLTSGEIIEQESIYIANLANEIARERNIPLLEFNADQWRSPEELAQVESFLNTL